VAAPIQIYGLPAPGRKVLDTCGGGPAHRESFMTGTADGDGPPTDDAISSGHRMPGEAAGGNDQHAAAAVETAQRAAAVPDSLMWPMEGHHHG
jgi:hypothetical protein